ncbi:hypothetical protein GCM10027284_09610 [Cyclobacterium sediminis]
MEITLKLKPVMSIKEFVDKQTKTRKKGLVYFQLLEGESAVITRVISDQTDKLWLIRMIKQRKIFMQTSQNIAESS